MILGLALCSKGNTREAFSWKRKKPGREWYCGWVAKSGRVGCHSFLRSSPFHGCLPREFTIRRSWTVMATVLPNQGAFTRFIVREL